jgi:Uma2 family endonuclease
MTTARTKRLTFEEWQALPETKQRCEVVDGVLQMPPSPTDEHQWLGFEIASHISPFVRERGLGLILMAPRDVLIQRSPLRIRQPDVLFLSAARAGVSRPSDLVGQTRIEAPLDLAIEVISPSNTRRYVEEKLRDYHAIGVLECWLVEFSTLTVEVWRFGSESMTLVFTLGMDDTLRSEVLPGFELPVADVFGPLIR